MQAREEYIQQNIECISAAVPDRSKFLISVRTHTYESVKRVLDIVLSTIGLLLLSPVFLIVALAVFIDDGHSPFYVQRRVGRNGRQFWLYKFRSMIVTDKPLEELLTKEELECYRRDFKLEYDPRVTRVGRFIRRTSIDELPQLVNIIKGDLSIIGPRPVTQEETELYGADRETFLSIRPGLTGYWQAYARNSAGYDTGKRQEMELYYVKNRGFVLDIKVFFKTFEAVLRKTGV